MLAPTEKLLRVGTITQIARAMEGAVQTATDRAAQASEYATAAGGHAEAALAHAGASAGSAAQSGLAQAGSLANAQLAEESRLVVEAFMASRPSIGANARVYPSVASFEIDLERPEYGVVEGAFYTFDVTQQQAVFAWSDIQRCSTYAALVGRRGGPGVIATVDRANGFMQAGGGLFRWAVINPYGGPPDHIITYPTEAYGADGSVWVRIWDGTVLHAAWAGCIADGVVRYLSDFYATLEDAQAVFGERVLPEGTDLSEVTLDWASAQHAMDRALYTYRATCRLPSGTLWTSDTLTAGALKQQPRDISGVYHPGDGYVSGRVEGAGPSFDANSPTILKPLFRDRPVYNVQAARWIDTVGISVVVPRVTAGPQDVRPADVEDWFDTGWTTGRTNPFCAFAVDGYSGATPAERYPGIYDRLPSVGVRFLHCHTGENVGVCVGLLIQPNWDGNGEAIIWSGGKLSGAYAVSIGNAQANIVSIQDGAGIAPCHTCFTNYKHGPGKFGDSPRGDMPAVSDVIAGQCYQIFDLALDYGDSKAVINLKAESVSRLGTITNSKSGLVTLIKPVINFDHGKNGLAQVVSSPAVLLDGGAHVHMMDAGMFLVNGVDPRPRQIMNFGAAKALLQGCGFGVTYEPFKEIFIDADTLDATPRDWKLLHTSYMADSLEKIQDNTGHLTIGRIAIGRHVQEVIYRGRRFRVQRSEDFDPWRPAIQAFYADFNAGSGSFAGGGTGTTQRQLTLTLTNVAMAKYLRAGDFAYWKTRHGFAASLAISSVNEATGVVVLDSLFTDVLENSFTDSYNLSRLWVVMPQFILLTEPKIGSVDGADPRRATLDTAATLKVGDFIFGAWDNAPARILAIDGSTVTFSHNVSQDFIGARLFNTRIIPDGARLTDGLSATSFWPRDIDAGTVRTITRADPITVSLEKPSSARLKLKAGAEIVIRQGGPGQITFQGINGGVIGASRGNKTAGLGAEVTVRVLDDDTWTLAGDLTT